MGIYDLNLSSRSLRKEDIHSVVIGFTTRRSTLQDSDHRCKLQIEDDKSEFEMELKNEIFEVLSSRYIAIIDSASDVITLIRKPTIGSER